MKPIWALRKRIYEETKDMTPEERDEYYRAGSERFKKRMAEINPDDCDLSFLYKKRENKNNDKKND